MGLNHCISLHLGVKHRLTAPGGKSLRLTAFGGRPWQLSAPGVKSLLFTAFQGKSLQLATSGVKSSQFPASRVNCCSSLYLRGESLQPQLLALLQAIPVLLSVPPLFFYCTSVVGFLSPWGCSVSNLPVFRPLSLEAFNRFAGRRHSLVSGALTGARLHLPACGCSRRTFPFGGRLHPRAVRAATCGLWQGVCIKLLEKILNSRLISFPRNK